MEQYYPNLLLILLGLFMCAASVLVGVADMFGDVVLSLAYRRSASKPRSKLCLPTILLVIGLAVFVYGCASLIAQVFEIHISFGGE